MKVTRIGLICLLIVIGVISRIIPHIPNFAPITAIALLAGVVFQDRKISMLVPIISMILGDILLQITSGSGFHSTWLWVYAGIIAMTLIGRFLKNHLSPSAILSSSIAGSIIFFFISNFGVWASTNMYPPTLVGLQACYLMGIPFFYGTFLSDVFYSLLFFKIYLYYTNKKPLCLPEGLFATRLKLKNR